MRRPTFCSIFEDEDQSVTSNPASSDKESRLSKVKRIITGGILLGRKGRKEVIRPQNDKNFQSNSPEFVDKEATMDLMSTKITMDEQFRRCQSTIATEAKSAVKIYDENMDAENVHTKSEICVCLSKENCNRKKVKEITIEISKSSLSSQKFTTTEILLQPRKRKERLDSGGSIKQDIKVIRSNSEERAEDNEGRSKDLNIRRVSSHEDFTRVRVLQEVNTLDNLTDKDVDDNREITKTTPAENEFTMSQMFHNADEIEHEKRRSCERFSRAVAPPRGRRTLQKRKMKISKKKRDFNDDMGRNLPEGAPSILESDFLNVADRDRSPSPGVSSSPPALDITTLHKQMEGSEPIMSRGKIPSPEEEPESPTIEALISPRNSLVMRLTHLDPSLPPSPPRDHNMRHRSYDSQEKRLYKQISSIKRQLRRYEDGFQEEFGYRPSHADKQANKDIKKLCLELHKYRTQLKQIKENSEAQGSSSGKQINFLTSLDGSNHSQSNIAKHPRSNKTMEEALKEIEMRLREKREEAGRSSEICEMSRADILEEKIAVQKALLHLENVFGRPVTREDRDLVRPLYQRYRTLKRLVARGAAGQLNNSSGELATILEHETMEFTSSPSSSLDIGEGTSSAPEGLNVQPSTSSGVRRKSQTEDNPTSSSSSDSLGENLHSRPLSELLEQQKSAREEKKRLKEILRNFEVAFQNENGRRARKYDRGPVEIVHVNYKQLKAKLRLLDALIAKKSCMKRNSC